MKASAEVCFTSACIPLLLFLSKFISEFEPLGFVYNLISIISLLLFIYIFISFQKLLTLKFNFFDANKIIFFWIWLNTISGILIIIFDIAAIENTLIAIISSIIDGVFIILFGIKMFKLKYRFGGLLDFLCYVSIATGICMISIFLAPLSIFGSILFDLILGFIFLHAGDKNFVNDSVNIN